MIMTVYKSDKVTWLAVEEEKIRESEVNGDKTDIKWHLYDSDVHLRVRDKMIGLEVNGDNNLITVIKWRPY